MHLHVLVALSLAVAVAYGEGDSTRTTTEGTEGTPQTSTESGVRVPRAVEFGQTTAETSLPTTKVWESSDADFITAERTTAENARKPRAVVEFSQTTAETTMTTTDKARVPRAVEFTTREGSTGATTDISVDTTAEKVRNPRAARGVTSGFTAGTGYARTAGITESFMGTTGTGKARKPRDAFESESSTQSGAWITES